LKLHDGHAATQGHGDALMWFEACAAVMVYPEVLKLGFSTACQASPDAFAVVVTELMSSWYNVLPERVKTTLVS
jgi:hypothetical protein